MRLLRHDFARLLASVTKVVESRNTIPILSTVRLIAGDGKLNATASDLDIEISGMIDAETPEAFAACIDAKLLVGIVSKIAGDEITIEATDDGATLKAGRSRYQLQTLPIDDFPTMAAGKLPTEFKADLAALFAPVSFAISTEETRYYLNGIYLAGGKTELTAVATDGHRLSRHNGEPVGEFAGIIIPRKAVGLVPKGAVTVRLSDAKIQFETADALITSKLIDGTFPDYERVIPKGNDRVVTFNIPEMIRAAGRVAVVATDREPAAKLEIDADEIALSVRGAGEAFDAVPCSGLESNADALTVGFNASYLGELLGIFPSGDVKMALADGGSPVLFTSDAAPGLLAVLMPRRV
jgi:DNA polymerase-3 subunit beta